jgi:hypothetical protein
MEHEFHYLVHKSPSLVGALFDLGKDKGKVVPVLF